MHASESVRCHLYVYITDRPDRRSRGGAGASTLFLRQYPIRSGRYHREIGCGGSQASTFRSGGVDVCTVCKWQVKARHHRRLEISGRGDIFYPSSDGNGRTVMSKATTYIDRTVCVGRDVQRCVIFSQFQCGPACSSRCYYCKNMVRLSLRKVRNDT